MSSTRDLVSAAIRAAFNSSVSLPCSWIEASTAARRSSSSRRYCSRTSRVRSWPSSRLPVTSLRYRAMNGTVAPSSSNRTAAATRPSSTANSSARRTFTDFTGELAGTRRLYRSRATAAPESPDDAVPNVHHAGGLEHSGELELGNACIKSVEQALTRTDDHRAHLEIDLVDEARLDRLTGAGCSTCNGDVPVAGRLLRTCVGRLDALGDEVEGGTALHLDRIVRMVGEDENRAVVRRLVTPPACPVGVAPIAANRAEHVAPHDRRAHPDHHVRDHLSVDGMVRGGSDVPLVKCHAADAERRVLSLVGPRDVTVGGDRHRKVGSGHGAPFGWAANS